MNQYIYTVEATRLSMFQEHDALEEEILPQHFAYVHKLVDDKVAILAGALSVMDSQHFGIVFFQAEDDASAKSILHNDPAVKNRVMRGCLYPHRMSLWNKDALTLEEGQEHFFYRIRPVRPEMISEEFTEFEGNTMGEHFMYLKGLTEKGIFALAGPTLVADNSNFGAGLLRADSIEKAWEIGGNDPAVIKRVMRLDIFPFSIAGFDETFSTE